jgi:diaminohydroxyphosphoribosylaminopyrimidine deaminase/5-amino-6-(5-phosphoribosylamino)uracil reductase
LIDAGITRVVTAVGDPDTRVAGSGFQRLRDAGITVEEGVETEVAERDLAPYLRHRRTGSAFVVAKVALSLDGRIAAADGTSQWITSEAARADAHELRADAQAIVVGAGTALKDQPALTVRNVELQPEHPPLRVLLDARGRVPATGPLFDTTDAPTMVFTTAAATNEAKAAWEGAGAKVEIIGPGHEGHGVDFDAVFARLGAEGVLMAMVEGGGTLLGAIIACENAHRIVAYVAPKLLGTRGAPAFAFNGPDSIDAAPSWNVTDTARVGADVRITLEPT